MARRFEAGKVFYITLDNVSAGSGIVQLVSPDINTVVQPLTAHISSHGGGPLEYQIIAGTGLSNVGVFLHGHVGTNTSQHMEWPRGFELPQGSGVFFEPLSNDGTINFYYGLHSETPGITKIQSRANTFNNVTQTRTPSNVVGQSKS